MTELPFVYKRLLEKIAKDNEFYAKYFKHEISKFRLKKSDTNLILRDLKKLGAIEEKGGESKHGLKKLVVNK